MWWHNILLTPNIQRMTILLFIKPRGIELNSQSIVRLEPKTLGTSSSAIYNNYGAIIMDYGVSPCPGLESI